MLKLHDGKVKIFLPIKLRCKEKFAQRKQWPYLDLPTDAQNYINIEIKKYSWLIFLSETIRKSSPCEISCRLDYLCSITNI